MGRHEIASLRCGSTVQLRPRDEALLRALTRFRLAKTTDLARLVFPGVRRDTAIARLRRLAQANYLAVHAPRQCEENLYSLGSRGHVWAAAQGLRVCRAPRGDVSHHLAIVDLWSRLAITVHAHGQWQLQVVRGDWELREGVQYQQSLNVPDLAVQLLFDGFHTVQVVVEIDLSTERAMVLRRKIARYRAQLGDRVEPLGWEGFGLVLAVRGWSLTRQERFGEFLEQCWPSWWVIWDMSEAASSLLGQLQLKALLPLTASPAVRGVLQA